MSKFLLVGLGNIGAEYEGTRHNIGFELADAWAAKHEGMFTAERLAHVARTKWKGKIVICIKPTTYMNLSGKAVKYWMDKENVSMENVLVMVDELALPLSKIRLRPGGSAAGHNGLKSIEEVLQTTEYPRLRFGIGNDYPRGMQVEFVLGRWTETERPLVKVKIGKCVELMESFVTTGIERTMSLYNKLVVSL
ncbi:MAG TPA: aminoacyl-tRNA hydrolase [Chitinophagaceae bacterium]|nr:aminoacyl-tRNA hydrolase [Chitinophagaceae bacterium]